MAKVRLALSAHVIVALLFGGGLVLAQVDAYGISWWTADGGGGQSTGGGYTLSGSIGQADAGTLAGGGYTLAGGFWAGSPPPAPTPDERKVYLPLTVKN